MSENVWLKADILDIEWFNVSTFANENYNFDNETYKELHWHTSDNRVWRKGQLFTCTLPDNIISQGIRQIIIKANSKANFLVIF